MTLVGARARNTGLLTFFEKSRLWSAVPDGGSPWRGQSLFHPSFLRLPFWSDLFGGYRSTTIPRHKEDQQVLAAKQRRMLKRQPLYDKCVHVHLPPTTPTLHAAVTHRPLACPSGRPPEQSSAMLNSTNYHHLQRTSTNLKPTSEGPVV